MAGIIRIEALGRLARAIEACVPELKGQICAGPAEAPHRLSFPSLSINPVRFQYFPDQARVWCSPSASRVVLDVGRVEGTVQLRLGTTTAKQRYALEQAILEKIFWSDPDRPGVAVYTLSNAHDAVVAYELDENTWQNEKAFDKQWYSVMAMSLQLPALVEKGGVYNVEEVRLTLTDDLTAPIASVPANSKETVSVDEEGALTPVSSP